MEDAEMRSGYCPNCNKKLSVPAELENFSCMYCGKSLTQNDLMEQAAEFDESVLYNVKDKLAGCILDNKDIMKQFNRNDFESAFEAYRSKYRPLFESLDECCTAAGPSAGEDLKNDAVKAFMDGISAEVSASKKPSKTIEQLRYIVALFFVPMVRSLGLKISDSFCYMLREQWISLYPKFKFEIGDYDAIIAGFKKKFLGLCFITTAVCEHSGKPDDCYELTAFRSFRDNYLVFAENGRQLIDEYYETAPVIVTCIDLLGEKNTVYPMLREKYLSPCLMDIENGRLEACKNRYIDMVRTLQSRYLKQ